MWALTIVAYQERTAVLQLAVEIDDGYPPAVPGGNNAIVGLKNEAARNGHRDIVPEVRGDRPIRRRQRPWGPAWITWTVTTRRYRQPRLRASEARGCSRSASV